MAKELFEEWLKEKAWVEIKHYHSDNGVFTAEESKKKRLFLLGTNMKLEISFPWISLW